MSGRQAPPPPDRPTRVYHHHLHKCGGSSLNWWLDEQTDDAHCWQPTWLSSGYAAYSNGTEPALTIADLAAVLRQRGIGAFHWSDIVHDHQAIGCHAPPGTFRFTMLRDPVARLLSQVADWRRLTDGDATDVDPALHACIADARHLPLTAFLERHGHATLRPMLDNYLVRSIAATRLGPLVHLIADAADLAAAAQLSLDQDYELVGITEQAALTRQILCRRLGWAPAPDVPWVNGTESRATLQDEIEPATAILAQLTEHDRPLYARAKARLAAELSHYTTDDFEAGPASQRLARLRGAWSAGRTVYSVRGPLIGSGWHGRDGAGTPDCAVWTGPGRVATLYIPTPPGQDITVTLWVRGYAAEPQRAALRLRIDGRPVDHRFEYQDGYSDVVAADATTTRDFVRLEIDAGDPVPSGTPGHPEYESRRRGLAFDRYGWAVR